MIDLIRKRHDGAGWQVFSELANGTGYKVKGWADAAALGIWPSRGYELHGYEFKVSREDLKKELRDPGKADNVGRYCHYWWLVVSDEKIMDGLVIPDAWGILSPTKRGSSTILRVVRKAPKVEEPKPFDPAFCAAMIRNVIKTWTPTHQYTELQKTALDQARSQIENENKWKKDEASYELDELKKKIARFTEHSGVDIADVSDWKISDIGEAVKTVVRARELAGRHADLDADGLVRSEIAHLERAADRHLTAAASVKAATDRVRSLLTPPPDACDVWVPGLDRPIERSGK